MRGNHHNKPQSERSGQNGTNHSYNHASTGPGPGPLKTRAESQRRMHSASVSVLGDQQTFVSVLSRKKRHLVRALSNSSVLERRLLFATLALFALALALLIALIIAASYRRSREKEKICESKECIKTASMLLQSMDTRADPCEDFYQFTCGNWAVPRLLPENAPLSWFSERHRLLDQRIVELLEQNSSNSDPKAVRQARVFYRSCVDVDSQEELGFEPMMEVLDKVRLPRGLPNATTATNFSLSYTLAAIQRVLNMDVLVQLTTYINPATNRSILLVSPSHSESSLPKVVSREAPEARLAVSTQFKAQVSYISEILAEILPEYNSSFLITMALRIVITDTQIKTDIRYSDKDAIPMVMSFKELQQLMDNARNSTTNNIKLNWLEYMNTLLKDLNVTMTLDSPVAVSSRSFFEVFSLRLSNFRPETIQRFIWWKLVDAMAPHTTPTMRRIRNNFLENLYGASSRNTRVKWCGENTQTFFMYPISYVMASENNLDESTKKVQAMLDDITSAFSGLVRALDWMDRDTKTATLGKAAAIRRFVGYPDWLLKPAELDKMYTNVNITKNRYLWNMLEMKARQVTEVLGVLGSLPPNQTEFRWDSNPIEVNAYYSRTINAISIPAGILQTPFYFLGLEALNYGAIGSILGHELTHGFDIEGKNFDKDGDLVTWWDSKVTDVFNKKAECFVDQYSKFSFEHLDDIRVNGTVTLAENIADNGGIREAINGYRIYAARNPPEPSLPGMQQYTHEQLLFLAFANVWCSASTPRHDIMTVYTDSHSPNKFRVLGSLSNSPEFAQVWQCRPGSRMNPTQKCILW